MFNLWLSWRYLRSGAQFLNFTSWLGVVGLAVGVGALLVSMAVVSGYESTLKNNIIDVTGHMILTQRSMSSGNLKEFVNEQVGLDKVSAFSPYLYKEGMVAHNKKLKGVFIEGFDDNSFRSVVHLKNRVMSGHLDLKNESGLAKVMIGKALATKYNLKVGDTFKMVLPKKSEYQSQILSPRVKNFKLSAILDFGRNEYNERYVIVNINDLQSFIERPDYISGVRVNMHNLEEVMPLVNKINQAYQKEVWAKGWRDHNRNLFEAVKYEKYVIFAVVLLMVIAASFNVSSTLFVNVFKRYSDISILKAQGYSQKNIIWMFSYQGLFIGLLGTLLGFLLGALACYGFLWAQEVWSLIPSETYKIDRIILDFKFIDLILILATTLTICFVSTIAPALRGARLEPVKGLRYE